jgi:hypothetical protein
VDITTTRLRGAITLEGGPLPSMLSRSYSGGFDLLLVSRETEQRHFIARTRYSGSSSTLTVGTDVIDAVLPPGVYDLIYERNHDPGRTTYWPFVSQQTNPSELPNGYVMLRQGIVLAPGTQTLNVDITTTRLRGAITLEGGPLPSMLSRSYSGGFDLLLVNRETEQRHFIARTRYSGSSSTLTVGTDVIDAVLPPGTYDLLYDRNHDQGSATYWPFVSQQTNPSELPNGYVMLRQGIVLAPGDLTLNVDIPVARLAQPITLEGLPLPSRLSPSYSGGFDLLLLSRGTGQRHFIARTRYSGSSSILTSGTDVIDAVLAPGVYDLVYDRNHDQGSTTYWPFVSQQTNPSELPNGYATLRSCVLVE